MSSTVRGELRAPFLLTTLVLLLAACSTPDSAPRQEQPPSKRPPRHTWDDDELRKIDFPEETAAPPKNATAAPAKRADPARPNVQLQLVVLDVISWDEVKVRGGFRGSPIKGVVSLTGWLATAKAKPSAEALVACGREASLDVAEPLRALTSGAAVLRVAVLDADEKGVLDLAVSSLASSSDDAQVAPATRIKLGPGEALVVGGHRTEEGDAKKDDRLVLVEASIKR